ncbi:helix-turn-helix domain-containing protein [Shimazuella kribbensis]|uniref:helix-turn-helix domain-containing protein n=1 Tax=Shimazuella kribbensis TaxID=139808 RepID=UPI0004042011|nr:helix-turn-helix domain-containing protein [Shimazuella kribbensis]
MTILAQRLKEARVAANFKQKEAAEKIEISNGSLSLYEKGRRDPDPQTLSKLADLYNVSVDWLLGRFSSTRKGFGRDHKNKATKKYLDLQIYNTLADLPDNIRKELQPPVLFYQVLQLRDGVPITISKSYLPNSLPIEDLKKALEEVKENPTLSLYKTLESFGRKPISCDEVLIVGKPVNEEIDLLGIEENVPVARITRKTFDASSKLVEYCQLTSRTDVYQFEYQFML